VSFNLTECLFYFNNLKKLYLKNVQIEYIGLEEISQIKNLEHFELSSVLEMRFNICNKNATHNSSLKTLVLNNIGIKSRDFVCIGDLVNLQHLDLKLNKIADLKIIYLAKLTDLSYLDLSFNQIVDIQCQLFLILTNLLYLYLNNNLISKFELVEISDSLNYFDFDISNNRLIEFSDQGLIYALRASNKIDLSFNSLVLFDAYYPGLEAIFFEELYLNNNQLKVIDNYEFGTFNTFDEVYLNDNKIELIEKYAFSNLMLLKKLNLRSNKISNLDRDTFNLLDYLEYLDISSNNLTFLDENLFNGLISLVYLDISSNNLYQIYNYTFKNLYKLEYLNLHSNVNLKLEDFSLFGLGSIKSLNISFSNLIGANNNNKFHIVSNLKSLKLHKMIDKRSYYESVKGDARRHFVVFEFITTIYNASV
jgi:Leucine-rich repeat (LRR) protein